MGHGLGAAPFIFYATSLFFTTSVVSVTVTVKQRHGSSPSVPVAAIRSSAGCLVSIGGTLGALFPCPPLITHTQHRTSLASSALAFVCSISCSTLSRRPLPFLSSPLLFYYAFRTRSSSTRTRLNLAVYAAITASRFSTFFPTGSMRASLKALLGRAIWDTNFQRCWRSL